jgi:hypothetical protein
LALRAILDIMVKRRRDIFVMGAILEALYQ